MSNSLPEKFQFKMDRTAFNMGVISDESEYHDYQHRSVQEKLVLQPKQPIGRI